jgi:hypothetical protein
MQQNPNQEELHTLQRQRRIQRAVRLRSDARHLREVAAHLALRGLRRSLRIQWQRDNAESIQYRGGPWYTLILYGENDYWVNGGPSLVGHNMSSTPSASPRPPPVRPRVRQRIHPSTTKCLRSASKNFRRKGARCGCHNNSVPHISDKKESLATHTPTDIVEQRAKRKNVRQNTVLSSR